MRLKLKVIVHSTHLKKYFSTGNFANELSDELKRMMHGRKGKERKDSVTNEILSERYIFRERIQAKIKENIYVDGKLLEYLDDHGLGSKRKRTQVYKMLPVTSSTATDKKTLTGAGGFITHVSSCTNNWPLFEHLLPEVAFAGHSNSGKSTLINALSGLIPRTGPASVSDRAGWTDQICFYRVGKRPPLLTLVDFPGYGHAVATANDRRAWTEMIRDYIVNRQILSTCCVLVDCTRGLCEQDKNFLWMLMKQKIPYLIILTKADLLSVDELAVSLCLVANDLKLLATEYDIANPNRVSTGGGNAITGVGPTTMAGCAQSVVPVSASTGAGVQALWRAVKGLAAAAVSRTPYASVAKGLQSTKPSLHHLKVDDRGGGREPISVAVREHYLADEMRRAYAASSTASYGTR